MDIEGLREEIERLVGRPLPELEDLLASFLEAAYQEGYEQGLEEARLHDHGEPWFI